MISLNNAWFRSPSFDILLGSLLVDDDAILFKQANTQYAARRIRKVSHSEGFHVGLAPVC